MESFHAQLFLAIQARIESEVSEIRWIDQDLGQLEFYTERPSVSWPCLLIDIGGTNYEDESQYKQDGSVSIELRLGFPPFSSAANASPKSVKENALKYYELEQKVYVALQGWQPIITVDEIDEEIAQPLVRKSSVTEKRDDPYRVRVLTYATNYQDASAMPESNKRKATIEFSFE